MSSGDADTWRHGREARIGAKPSHPYPRRRTVIRVARQSSASPDSHPRRQTVIRVAGQSSVSPDSHPCRQTVIRVAGQSSASPDSHPRRRTVIRVAGQSSASPDSQVKPSQGTCLGVRVDRHPDRYTQTVSLTVRHPDGCLTVWRHGRQTVARQVSGDTDALSPCSIMRGATLLLGASRPDGRVSDGRQTRLRCLHARSTLLVVAPSAL
jgi:hypothetical protein